MHLHLKSSNADRSAIYKSVSVARDIPARGVDQPREVVARPVAIAGLRSRLSRSVKASEAVRVAQLRAFIFRQRIGGLATLEQHVAEKFVRRHEAARADRALLTFVLEVSGGVHQVECRIAIAPRKRNQRRAAQALHFYFDRPVGILARFK